MLAESQTWQFWGKQRPMRARHKTIVFTSCDHCQYRPRPTTYFSTELYTGYKASEPFRRSIVSFSSLFPQSYSRQWLAAWAYSVVYASTKYDKYLTRSPLWIVDEMGPALLSARHWRLLIEVNGARISRAWTTHWRPFSKKADSNRN